MSRDPGSPRDRPEDAPVVLARGLVVGYGPIPVCAPVDLSLRPGQVLALVGANGSGKSTVLRAVLGLLEPLSGRLEVFGAPVDERLATVRARVAGVLDDDAWFPGLTVREHLLLTAAGHGVRNTSTVVDDLLETFGLTDHEDAVPSALSSGQRRRLLLAAGFVRPRDLLVLDEPEQRLDAAMRSELAELIRAEARRGTAVLLATHDPALLTALGARAVLLDDDRCRRLSAADAVAAITGVL
ncbi:ABC transporter ATP-binding protein [Actinotalea sp.]|uniref:ABC transporter ATP-binding protein n=1 Tax=Actinotalea sp. TaxID=1872145 RepID=UPI002C0F38A5|nr:ABC transporter ATP-binding protein [Actinotalea sp.]HQY34784.1 ABC transporter ATP-binding protein [Actinotalea sp.]HRA51385.1 ABC transporter ATP-binding protein [Actinotalea sp.]